MLRACRHGPRVGVGQRYQSVRGIGQRLVNGQQTVDLLADAAISAGQMRRPLRACRAGLLTVDPVGLLDRATDLGFQRGEAAGDLAPGDVAVAIVDRLDLGAPSTATTSPFSTAIRRQRSTTFAQVFPMAGPRCPRNSAMVL
ncbi:MAG: hypothetical protein ABS73_09565 [Paracoccus sp. SCN 68-21]|nr:MAG: hypothetical protein ABS73_09565 [Paracoccus sp. SCN 68-21]